MPRLIILYYLLQQSWPEDALTAVASRFLEDVEMTPEHRKGCIDACKNFHTTTRLLSERFFNELQRHNYVTPTSYLELISTFKSLLGKRRDVVHKLKRRYEVGLEKLNSAAGQVCAEANALLMKSKCTANEA